LCFRFRTSYASPIPLYLFRTWQTIWSTHASTKSFESRILQAVGSLDPDRLPLDAEMPKSVCMARVENKEKFYRHFLEKLASEIWLSELRAEPPPGRLWSYVNLHLRPPLCRHLFQPSLSPCSSALPDESPPTPYPSVVGSYPYTYALL
jgi:hypothetical protein